MPNPLVALGGASLAAGIFGAREASRASDRAVNASADATEASIAEARRQFDLVRGDTRLARDTGNDALMQLGFLLGVRTPPSADHIASLEQQIAAASGRPAPPNISGMSEADSRMAMDAYRRQYPDVDLDALKAKLAKAKHAQALYAPYEKGFGEFLKSQPGYEFGLQEGNNAVTNMLTAKGQSQGGKAIKAAERFGIDYAGSKADEHLSKLFTLAGYGPAAANMSANAGANLSNAVTGANADYARTVGDAAYGNAAANVAGVNNLVNTGVSLWTYNDYMNRMRPSGATT